MEYDAKGAAEMNENKHINFLNVWFWSSGKTHRSNSRKTLGSDV